MQHFLFLSIYLFILRACISLLLMFYTLILLEIIPATTVSCSISYRNREAKTHYLFPPVYVLPLKGLISLSSTFLRCKGFILVTTQQAFTITIMIVIIFGFFFGSLYQVPFSHFSVERQNKKKKKSIFCFPRSTLKVQRTLDLLEKLQLFADKQTDASMFT